MNKLPSADNKSPRIFRAMRLQFRERHEHSVFHQILVAPKLSTYAIDAKPGLIVRMHSPVAYVNERKNFSGAVSILYERRVPSSFASP